MAGEAETTALQRYGRHDEDCAYTLTAHLGAKGTAIPFAHAPKTPGVFTPAACDCGFDAALQQER